MFAVILPKPGEASLTKHAGRTHTVSPGNINWRVVATATVASNQSLGGLGMFQAHHTTPESAQIAVPEMRYLPIVRLVSVSSGILDSWCAASRILLPV